MLLTLGLLLAIAPAALAQNDTGGDDTDVFIDPPDNIDIDVTDNRDGDGDRDVDESVGMGWSATTILIVVIVAVLLIALIIGLAGRDRWGPPPP